MERLTERFGNSVRVKGCRTNYISAELPRQYTRNAIVRLAAYEDSSLTPEEVAELAKIVRCKDCKYRDGSPGQPNILCYQMHDDDFCSYSEKKGER